METCNTLYPLRMRISDACAAQTQRQIPYPNKNKGPPLIMLKTVESRKDVEGNQNRFQCNETLDLTGMCYSIKKPCVVGTYRSIFN